jgi:MerR family transcriptional regulator, repressor of the yfmOP operon
VTVTDKQLRIGEVAERVGVTTRTIRYYEERGLLGGDADREKGTHRLYDESDVTRLQELMRMKDLLGLSLEELVEIAEAEGARAELRDQWADTTDDRERLRIVDAAIPLVQRQLELVRARRQTLDEFAGQLDEKLKSLRARKRELR